MLPTTVNWWVCENFQLITDMCYAQPGFGFEHLSIIAFLWFFHEFFESSSSTVSSSFLENGFFSVKYFVVIKFLQTKMISSAKRATDQRQQQKPFPCFFRATTATTENSNHFSHAHLRRLLATFLVWPYQETSSDFSFFLRLKKQFGVRQIIKSRTMANRFWLWIKIKLGCWTFVWNSHFNILWQKSRHK